MKWHQAHTTWFFETFVLRPFLPGYRPFCDQFGWLFNSYYNSLGEEAPEKHLRAAFSRPSLDEILAFRLHVDDAMEELFTGEITEETARLIVLGLNHEQQHQELMLTDIKHAFFTNPLRPAYQATPLERRRRVYSSDLRWHGFEGGVVEIGHRSDPADCLDFCFDNETPRHKAYLEPFRIANRSVTCAEYLEFISDDAYGRPELWLSEGWEVVRTHAWRAPLYWQRDGADSAGWRIFTLRGWHPLSALLDTPVCHVSFFEADAFARWKGCRLPTEAGNCRKWQFDSRKLARGGHSASHFSFPVPQPVSWDNTGSTNGSAIYRGSPYTNRWSGGDSNGFVDIQGYAVSGSALSGTYYVGFECAAPVSAGQFIIPSSILLAMPPNTPGTIQVSTIALPNILGQVPGFDAAVSGSQFQASVGVIFK